jgi:hypothetical protein
MATAGSQIDCRLSEKAKVLIEVLVDEGWAEWLDYSKGFRFWPDGDRSADPMVLRLSDTELRRIK